MNLGVILLYTVTFVDLFAVGLVVPLINLHVTNLGHSHSMTGLIGSFYSGLQLFSSPVMGSLSDVEGRKPVLLTALLCCGVAYLLFGIVRSIYLLLILRMFLGIFKHTQILAKAYVGDISEKRDHSEIFGKMAAISGAGITLGPLVGGHILEDYPEYGFSLACALTCLLFLFNAGLVCLIKSNDGDKKTEDKKPRVDYVASISDGWNKSWEELKSVDWHLYWDVFLLKGLSGFGMSVFYSIYSPLLRTLYQLTPKSIGYTISFHGVVGSLCSFFIRHINDRMYPDDVTYTRRIVHCFVMFTVTFTGLLACHRWWMFMVLLVPLAMGNAILRLVTLEVIVRKCPESQRGSLIGASNSVRSVAGIMGPFAAGVVGDSFGVNYVLLVSLASVVVGCFVSRNLQKSEMSGTRNLKID